MAILVCLLGAVFALVLIVINARATRAEFERKYAAALGALEKAKTDRAMLAGRKERELSQRLALASKQSLRAEEKDTAVQPQLAALLAIEALRHDQNRESRDAVREVVSSLLRPLSVLERPGGPGSALITRKLSPSGRYTVSIAWTDPPQVTEGSLCVLDTATGTELVRFPAQWKDAGIEEIVFSPNEESLMVKDRDRAWGKNPESIWVFHWHRQWRRRAQNPPGQGPGVPAPQPLRVLLNERMQLRFSADSRSIVALLPARVRIYDAETLVVRRELPLPDPPSSHALFRMSPTSPLLFAYDVPRGKIEVVKLVDLNSGSFTQVAGFPQGLDEDRGPLWLEFSFDGRFLLIANREFLAVWGVTGGRTTPQPLFVTKHRWFTAVALSPDGGYAAATDYFDVTHVYKVKTGQEIASRRLGATNLMFSRDGNWLIGSTEAEGVAVWSFKSDSVFARASDGGQLWEVRLSNDGRYLYTEALHAAIRVWEMPSPLGTYAHAFSRSDKLVWLVGLRSSKDSSVLAANLSSAGVVAWETATKRTLYESKPGSYAMDLSADGKTLALISGNELSLIELATSKVFQRIPLTSQYIEYQSPELPERRARVFYMEPSDAVPRLFDGAESTEEVPSGPGLGDLDDLADEKVASRIQRKIIIRPPASQKTSRQLPVGFGDNVPVYRETPTGKDWRFAAMGWPLHGVRLSSDNRRVAVSTLDYLFVFDMQSGKRIARLALGYELHRLRASMSSRGRARAAADSEVGNGLHRSSVDVRDFCFQEGAEGLVGVTASGLTGQPFRFLLRPDGSAEGGLLPSENEPDLFAMSAGLMATAKDDQIQILRLDGSVRWTLPAKGSPLKFSDDGRWLVVRERQADGDRLTIWNLQSGALKSTIAPVPTVQDAFVSADGESLLVTGTDTQTRLYRIADATEQARIPQTDRYWDVLALDAHARFVVSHRSDDRFVTITPLQSQDLLDAACARTLRNLTPEEWQHSLDGEPARPTCPARRQ
ncbi:MAG TPA: WD40 repeat domain-containing protein [Pseudomonadota bacterium]|nr:WD40 repeat domain-containing protein [Pseudomonadota bacterium]